MDTQRIDGLLVAVCESSYDSFKDRQTGEVVPGGTSTWCHVSVAFTEPPVKVRIQEEDRATWEGLRSAGQGVQVSLMVELRAKGVGNGAYLERRLRSVLPGQQAAASNGRAPAAATA